MPKKMISLLVLVMALISLIPMTLLERVCAQEEYEITTGIDAVIVGTKEYAPGSKSTIQVCIQNNNVVEKIDATAMQSNMSQMYGSAVSLTVYMEKGNAPVVIKTEKLLLGTLHAGEVTQAIPFSIEVDESAKTGRYQLKLVLNYRTLVKVSEKEGSAGAGLDWSNRSDTKELTIEVRRQSLKFEVTKVEANLQQGSRTDIEVVFTNTDNKVAYDAEAELSAQGPISLTQNSSFLGAIEPDKTGVGKFGIKVTGDAIPKDYALDAVVKYRDESGNEYITNKIRVPVEVHSNSSIAEFFNINFIGIIIGLALMGIAWFVVDKVTKGRARKK